MDCSYCGEPLDWRCAPATKLHPECMTRILMGSAAHQLKDCRHFGGRQPEDPPGLTLRQSAWMALEVFNRPMLALAAPAGWEAEMS